MAEYEFITPAAPRDVVGWWVLPGSGLGVLTHFGVYVKPSWFHRTMMRCLLGWGYTERK